VFQLLNFFQVPWPAVPGHRKKIPKLFQLQELSKSECQTKLFPFYKIRDILEYLLCQNTTNDSNNHITNLTFNCFARLSSHPVFYLDVILFVVFNFIDSILYHHNFMVLSVVFCNRNFLNHCKIHYYWKLKWLVLLPHENFDIRPDIFYAYIIQFMKNPWTCEKMQINRLTYLIENSVHRQPW